MYKKISLCLVLTLLLSLTVVTTPFVSCGKSKDTLIIGVANTPPTIDHEVGAGMASQYMILDNVMAPGAMFPLVKSKEPGMDHVLVPDLSDLTNLQPQLYESWEVSPDRKTATFHLRKGVKSAYGNELTTKDVLWKYERHFALGAVGRFVMAVTDIYGTENIKIIDDYTYVTESTGPNTLQELVSTNLYDTIWDSTEARKHATPDDPWAQDWISRHGGGFGAYYVADWVAGQHVILKANPNYWQGKPRISTVIFKVIPESSNRVAMLKRGEIDIATELAPREVDSLKGAPGVKIVSIPANTNDFLVLNQKLVKPFADKRVRQAINYAIPQDAIVETAYYGQAKPWHAVIPSMIPGTMNEKEWKYNYDLKKAKRLLEEVGYGNGFSVELYYSAGWPAHETAAVMVKDSLEKIGVNVDLRKTPTGSFDTLVRSYEAPFAILHEYPAIPNPFFSSSLYYLSKRAGGAYGAFGYYDSPVLDDLLLKGVRTWPLSEQYKVADKAQRTIMEDAPMGWLVESYYTAGIRDNVENFNWNFASQGTWFHLMSIK